MSGAKFPQPAHVASHSQESSSVLAVSFRSQPWSPAGVHAPPLTTPSHTWALTPSAVSLASRHHRPDCHLWGLCQLCPPQHPRGQEVRPCPYCLPITHSMWPRLLLASAPGSPSRHGHMNQPHWYYTQFTTLPSLLSHLSFLLSHCHLTPSLACDVLLCPSKALARGWPTAGTSAEEMHWARGLWAGGSSEHRPSWPWCPVVPTSSQAELGEEAHLLLL